MRPALPTLARSLLGLLLALMLTAVLAWAWVRSGRYDVGADDPHLPATHALLRQLREASIGRRAARLAVPADLASPARIAQGAGNYEAMCRTCHLAPGMPASEIARGLYPAPPDMSRTRDAPAVAFWTIKHGVKASGMAAWGRSMDEASIWNLVAFLQVLPTLDAAGYRRQVASSQGHSHGRPGEGARPHADPRPHEDPPGAAPHEH